jgi:hypothetical protein
MKHLAKTTTTLSIEENLLEDAKKKFPRQLGKKFEEFLAKELDTSRELERLKSRKSYYQAKVDAYTKQINDCEILLKSKKDEPTPQTNMEKAISGIVDRVKQTHKLSFEFAQTRAHHYKLDSVELYDKIVEQLQKENIEFFEN